MRCYCTNNIDQHIIKSCSKLWVIWINVSMQYFSWYPVPLTVLQNVFLNGGLLAARIPSLLKTRSGLLPSRSTPYKLAAVICPPWASYSCLAAKLEGRDPVLRVVPTLCSGLSDYLQTRKFRIYIMIHYYYYCIPGASTNSIRSNIHTYTKLCSWYFHVDESLIFQLNFRFIGNLHCG